MGKGLTEEQIASYHQNGFLFPLDIISREKAAEYLQNLEAFEAGQNQQMGKGFNFKPHLLFRWVDEIVHHPVILNAVEDLIGPNLRLFNLAVFPKNAHDAAYVTWHQDSTYFWTQSADANHSVDRFGGRAHPRRLYGGCPWLSQIGATASQRTQVQRHYAFARANDRRGV